jgi:myo-inositol-1(or 4)-monophosphatase
VSDAELIRIAREAARASGRLLLEAHRSRPDTREKRPHDLVTAFDLESEALLRQRLSGAAPGIGFVAEEGGGHVGEGACWYCDPLDGTTNFVHGHPCWAVSVGLLDARGRPRLGVVRAPALGIEWWGIVGGRALRDGAACHVSETARLDEALLATGFPPDRSAAPANNLDAFCRVMQRARGIRRCGSAAIDCCFVADGTYDGYWERGLHPWDYAGGCAVALAAGAVLTDLSGEPADLRVGDVVLTNGRVHDELLELVP